MRIITTILIFNFALWLTGCGNSEKKENHTNQLESKSLVVKESFPTTLYFSAFEVYLNNWKNGWKIANHGQVCKSSNIEGQFIVGIGSTMICTMTLSIEGKVEEIDYASFGIVKREVIWNKNLDLFFQTTGENKVKIEFRNLLPKYEKWISQNLSLLPPMEDVTLEEIKLTRLPIVAPNKRQGIEVLLDFEHQDDASSNFNLLVRNNISRLGAECVIAKNLQGKLTSSLGSVVEQFKINDTVSVSVSDQNKSWNILRKKKAILVQEINEDKIVLNLEIPISQDFDWNFLIKEY
ncbi:hypothetical protein [Aquimarina sp. AU474]|uniref:hypothetical protein n=1 Tax=Aquimarina sp. AU474 TaxID=2108529 RepID=UPI000D693C84|nr:hypothetical protein [Aquimarina sp. AU474]